MNYGIIECLFFGNIMFPSAPLGCRGENYILTIICKNCPCCNKLANPDDLDDLQKIVILDRPFFHQADSSGLSGSFSKIAIFDRPFCNRLDDLNNLQKMMY